MQAKELREKVLAAQNLLTSQSITRETFESVRTLLKGVNPKLDDKLNVCAKALWAYGKLEKGEVVELTADALPEQTEEEKKRKRAIFLLIRSWKDLRSEVERVKSELEVSSEASSTTEQAASFGRIVVAAKGPFGIITIAAIVIVGTLAFVNSTKSQPSPIESSVKGETSEATPVTKSKIQVIEFNGKRIPLSALTTAQGQECDGEHYHAKDHVAAKTLDGTMVSDPGGCGFGKVKEVSVLEVEQ